RRQEARPRAREEDRRDADEGERDSVQPRRGGAVPVSVAGEDRPVRDRAGELRRPGDGAQAEGGRGLRRVRPAEGPVPGESQSRMPNELAYVIAGLISYFVGAIPSGYILVKLKTGKDIRTMGSGNIGATNVARTLGVPWFIPVFVFDFLKGFVPVFWMAP